MSIPHDLVDKRLTAAPFDDAADWAASLRRVASRPLTQCPHFPQRARRHEAWWRGEVTGPPILIARVNTQPQRPITRRLDLLEEPDRWLQVKRQDMLQLHDVGDALPHVRVDFGPVLLGSMFGDHVDLSSDTAWTPAMINDDWSNLPNFEALDDRPWWRRLRELLERTAADAAGNYLLCTPDLGGSADVLLNLRGSTELCLDVIDRPERVIQAIDVIYPAWRRTFDLLYRIAAEHEAGLIHWLGIWSDVPYLIPACDFNFMIGEDEFERICLPDIARQCAAVGRAVFHLDGPGAVRHLDALLTVPEIRAIQYTPGAGTPSALPWIEMFHRIQAAGRSVYVFCPASEAVEVARALDPARLLLHISDAGSVEALQRLEGQLHQSFGSPGD